VPAEQMEGLVNQLAAIVHLAAYTANRSISSSSAKRRAA
jgi:GntR family transcriptional regulator/MocR family aminotransferase